MRALNPRRPQLTSTFGFFPRSLLRLLLLFFVLHAGQPRSVIHDEEDRVQSGAKLSAVENGDPIEKISSKVVEVIVTPEQVQGKFSDGDHDVEKAEEVVSEEVDTHREQISKAVAGKRNDDPQDATLLGEGSTERKEESKLIDAVFADGVTKQKDEEASVAKKRRRNDVALIGKTEVGEGEGIAAEHIGDAKEQGIRRFDVRLDAEGVAPGVIDAQQDKKEYEGSVGAVESEKSEASDDEGSLAQEVEKTEEEIPKHFRKAGKIEDERGNGEEDVWSNESLSNEESKETLANRNYGSLVESEGKGKRKSSTVYLNAEEKKIPDGEQQSIVDGQIKRLISIRDDALDARKSGGTEETKLLRPKGEIGLDEVAITREEVRSEQIKKVKKEVKLYGDSFLKKWKDQAVSLQGQIRDRTFVQRLREQTTEVLPEIPKFTENQLLDTLEQIVLSKKLQPPKHSYTSDIRNLELSENQLRIIKCAEQLVAIGERQSFVDNVAECIRGLSILNCMRIFVWPIIVENLPQAISQSLGNLPIELNVFDLFQNNRPKSGRAQDLHQIRLLTPDLVVFNILQDALESYPNDETLVSYVDPKNDTLKKLLTSDQLNILQMAEKFLPQALRREYSDKMFSCVRRFEYFSCVKYFAWPLIKQYFPALPAFPDYQSWYPIVDLSPQYPIFPFPSFSEDIGELPEVVDADATRTRKPRPEAIIIQVLENTLKEQPRISTSPSFLDRSSDTYVTLIPEDQLLSINMAEQLIPISYRPEFVQKTVRCMKEYNYLSCFKYSTWPTVRQFIPTLPDISSLLPEFQTPALPEINSYVPLCWPVCGTTTVQRGSSALAYLPLKNQGNLLNTSEELEIKIFEILTKVRNSIDKIREMSSFIFTGNSVTFVAFTKRQIDILRLAESLVPPSARPALITDILSYLRGNDNFIDCARYVIWPTIATYVPNLPEFPRQEAAKDRIDVTNAQASLAANEGSIDSTETIQERFASDSGKETKTGVFFEDKESRHGMPNVPVISVTGTRFVPIYTEHPESVILNILRSVQLQSFKSTSETASLATKNQQFLDFLTQQQVSIIAIVDTLLPESVRPDFANKMIECLRVNNFLICTRDVVWPMLIVYFPWLPNFPNFGIIAGTPPSNSSSTTSNQTLTEPSASSNAALLSETAVKTGQHGDTTVTITDTRFFPIYNELPETIILNILKAVQLSIPNLPGSPVSARIQDFADDLTEQQINIIQIAENLLPIPARSDYIDKVSSCIKEGNFLECTRDITWPTIAQSYPWLPSYPNFGTLQSLPQESTSNSVRFQVFLSDKPSASNEKVSRVALLKQAEEKIESVLSNLLEARPEVERSYLNITDSIASMLSPKQINIVRLVERGIPEATRSSYVSNMLVCLARNNFITCTNGVSWPILKQSLPSLPDLSSISSIFSQLPDISQIPELGQIPNFSSDSSNIPGIPELPGVSQISAGISQLPSQLGQLPSQLGQLPQLPLQLGEQTGSKANEAENVPRSEVEVERSNIDGNSPITPSVGNKGSIPGYAGQPAGLPIDISGEKVQLPGNLRQETETKSSQAIKNRKRRSTVDILASYYDTEGASDSFASSESPSETFPNITESEYLQLLIKVKEKLRFSSEGPSNSKRYFVDTLNSTVRNSLTADQYEILKIVEDLDDRTSGKGLASQVIQCITGLSFIRCLGIFVWPLIVSNLPSLVGFPSFPSFGILGRSLDTESQLQDFFGMSTSDFEKELLKRRDSIESVLLDWYKKLAEDKFQANVGIFKIKGYGNNELEISFSGFREGRGAKLKDNKNLPSILTIISDIMEEVLDQRPEGEKPKKEKEKKERSIVDSRETDIQFLKDSEEYVDIKRSMNDHEIISMFLDKIRSNDSEIDENTKYFTSEDAYDAFGVLFGTKLQDKLASQVEPLNHRLKSFEEGVAIEPSKEVDIVSLESRNDSDELKVLPLKSQVAYDFEKESSIDQEEKQRQKRAKNFFQSFLDKHKDKYLKDYKIESFESAEDNKITGGQPEKDANSRLVIQLPSLHEEIVPKKVTHPMSQLGKGFKTKMTQMMPGFGLMLSFLLQMALAHARAAASMAGMISNIALGSAMFGMMRDSLFGSNSQPKIKYVYDNDKNGPGISWPTRYDSNSHYYG